MKKYACFLYWCIYLCFCFLFLFTEPKVSRRKIVPKVFLCVFVDVSTAEEQPELDVKIELTVNGQTCEAQYADVLKDHAKLRK